MSPGPGPGVSGKAMDLEFPSHLRADVPYLFHHSPGGRQRKAAHFCINVDLPPTMVFQNHIFILHPCMPARVNDVLDFKINENPSRKEKIVKA